VADLQRLGYAERVPDARDQRVRTVRLTRAGQGVLAEGRRARAELEAEVAEQVGAADVAAANTALAALLRLTGVAEHVPDRSVPLPR
jgi:DNA-binding MarR family transcriptional regulator